MIGCETASPARPTLHAWKLTFADYAAQLIILDAPLFTLYRRTTPDARECVLECVPTMRPRPYAIQRIELSFPNGLPDSKVSMTKTIKLFIPGPREVSQKTFAAMTQPMIGHRSPDFKALYRAMYPGLQQLFQTQQPVFLSTSSAWGVMEGAIRNLVKKGVLN